MLSSQAQRKPRWGEGSGSGGGATPHTSDSPVLGTVPGTQWALGKYCVDSDIFYHQIWADSRVIGALGMSLHLVTYSPPVRRVPCSMCLLVSVIILFLWLVCFRDGIIKNDGNSVF